MRLLIEAANAAVGVEEDRIVPPDGSFDVVISVPDGDLLPGLINAHDHLHRNHYGRLGTPFYQNSYAWGRDIHSRDAVAIARGRAVSRRRALLCGAWKNLVSGVTTVVHHDPWEPDFDTGFPLRVARIPCLQSLGLEPEITAASAGGSGPFAIHLAEGTDPESAEEVRELERRGLLTSALLAVHVVGPDDDGVARLRSSGAAVVWCPSSNLFLFGRTVPAELLAPGIDVLLGSDSLLTAAGALLDEVAVARRLELLSDERLLAAIGDPAARRLGLPAPRLVPGQRADLVVFRRPVLEARADDVALVVAGGVLRVLDPRLLPALGGSASQGRITKIDGVVRWISGRPSPESIAAVADDRSARAPRANGRRVPATEQMPRGGRVPRESSPT